MAGLKIRGFPDSPEKVEHIDLPTPEEKFEEEKVARKKRGPKRKKSDQILDMSPMDRLIFVLKDIKDAPSEVQLEEWKDTHKKFYFSSVDGDDIYIWRTIRRTEYKSLMTSGALDKPGTLEEFLVRRCLLWPKASQEFMQHSDAGIITSLFKQISAASGFVDESVLLGLVQKL